MTWVVGHPTLFSCIGLADIQATVTHDDGSKKFCDCIQKIYPLCLNVAVGFCGCVKLGFDFIRDAHRYFGFPDVKREWSPYIVVHKLRRLFQWRFSKLSEDERKSVQFMILGISPVNTPLPKTWGWILKSPHFDAESIPFAHVASIGSGNNVEAYMDIVRNINQSWDKWLHPDGPLKAEVAKPGGFGAAMGLIIASDAAKIRVCGSGVSSHFHLCLVRRGEIRIWPNNRTDYPLGKKPIEFRMPPTVASWADFVEHMRHKGIHVNASNAMA